MKRLLACFVCSFAFLTSAAAHVLDEYVQAAQIALAPGGARIELRLVPGVEVAYRVLTLIDVDGDGQISRAEQQAYARQVLEDITLEVDGRRAPLVLTGIQFPLPREMSEGTGAIRLDLKTEIALTLPGNHQLSFRNDHLPKLSVYLVNALAPTTSEIKISGQTRDPLQHEIRLSYQVSPKDSARTLQAPQPWTAVLILCLDLVLLVPLPIYLSVARKGPEGLG